MNNLLIICSFSLFLLTESARVMTQNPVLDRLSTGKPVYGAFISSKDSAVVEQFGLAELD
jgi:hypothetical protein